MRQAKDLEQLVRQVVEKVVDGRPQNRPSESTSPPSSAKTRDGRIPVAIGADHGGFPLKQKIAEWLRDLGYEAVDCGTHSTDAADYPDFAHAVAREVALGRCRWGIVVDGAGIGSAMTANKVPGVRAALCYDLSSARNSREHNLANVLTLGSGLIGEGLAKQIVREWLSTPWGGDRHARRVGLISDVEAMYLRDGGEER